METPSNQQPFQNNAESPLLHSVLSQLGLANGEARSGLPTDELVASLQSQDWRERLAAIRALGKRGGQKRQ